MDTARQQKPTPKGPHAGPQAAPRRRRGRPPKPRRTRANAAHPGVVLLPPRHRHGWRARYRDPISGRVKRVTLLDVDSIHDPARPELDPAQLREAWAVDMAAKIQRVISDRKLGRRKVTDVEIGTARTLWLASEPWSPATLRLYRYATQRLVEYVGAAMLVRELAADQLVMFRAASRSARTLPRGRKSVRGGTRELISVNHELRICASFLRWCRTAASCQITRDEIAESLKAFRVTHERKPHLETAAIRVLLEKARRYETPAYDSIVCLLLTGMRAGELQALRWEWIQEGDRIRLPAAVIKTAEYRDIDLTVAPEAIPARGRHAFGPVFSEANTGKQLRYAFERLRQMDPRLANVSAHMLRRTCATYFTCAFNPWRSAKSLGHSVLIAEKHYAGLVRVPAGCTTIAQAMGIDDMLAAPAPKPLRNARKPRKDRGTTKRTAEAA